jgi:hypothetical protein
MRASEAQTIVGHADEKRADSTGPAAGQLWCFGIEKPGHLPTLGSFIVDKHGRIATIFGQGQSTVQDVDGQEGEVRRALSALDHIGDTQGTGYDPLAMIQAVNTLRSLGKDQALAVVREYLRVVPNGPPRSERVIMLVLRLLFDTEGVPPRIVIGAPSPEEPKDHDLKSLLPLFPLVVVQDVPFLVVADYRILGRPSPATTHIDYYEEHGALRGAPFKPTDNLRQLLTAMEHSAWWRIYSGDPQRGRNIMTCQLSHLARTVAPDLEGDLRFTAQEIVADKWLRAAPRLNPENIAWEASTNCYVLRKR